MEFYNECLGKFDESTLIDKYRKAKKTGDAEFTKLLLGNETIEENGSNYQEGDHGNKSYNGLCFKIKDNANQKCDEKQIIKCLFVNSLKVNKTDCNGCPLQDKRRYVRGDFTIVDYEVPICARTFSKSNIDLLLKETNSNIMYAVEVKPPIGNDNSILRMVAEILTYLYVLKETRPKLNYKPAIGFFEGSLQEKYYGNMSDKLSQFIVEEGISVFCIKEDTKKSDSYYIEKLK